MSEQFRREKVCDGVYFNSATDPKFRHNRMTANLVVSLDRQTATANALVPYILRKGCRALSDFTQLNRRLSALYGASLSCDVGKYGGYQVLSLSIYAIDDRFTLDDEKVTQACAQLLADILLDPKLENDAFPEEEVRMEKQQLIDLIESQINDKRVYALSRCKSAMFEGERFAVETYGYIEDAKALTPAQVTQAYREIIKTAQVELFFVGCGSPQVAKQTFANAFSKLGRAPVATPLVSAAAFEGEPREVIERMDVAQSKLVLGMRTGEIKDAQAFAAMRMMVALYGGTPNSRLFVYVREKLSLCYYCAARLDRLTGLVMVDSGVESANRQKAQDEILNQLEIVRRGEFTDEEIEAARLTLCNSLRAVGDSLGSIEDWYMVQVMSGRVSAPEAEAALLAQVTREDIMAAARQVRLDTVYFLTGKEAQ